MSASHGYRPLLRNQACLAPGIGMQQPSILGYLVAIIKTTLYIRLMLPLS